MVFQTPTSFLFVFSLMVSSVYVISSPNWVSAWMALEINMLSFIPMMMMSGSGRESEGAIKYFLAQASGSVMFLLGGLNIVDTSVGFGGLIVFGLFMKAGMAPCYFWFPQVMSCMSWPMCMVLSSWQKVAPMLMLFQFCQSSVEMFYVGGVLSAVVGALGVITQSHMRALMAYSSINHMGWMVSVSVVSYGGALNYLLIYIIMVVPLMVGFFFTSVKWFGVESPSWALPGFRVSTLILMLSLGGVPPFLGFFPKALAISLLGASGMFFMASVLVISSLITLYVYFNIFFFSFSTSKPLFKGPFFSQGVNSFAIVGSATLGVPQFMVF